MITPEQIREKAADMRRSGAATFEAAWLEDIAQEIIRLQYALKPFASCAKSLKGGEGYISMFCRDGTPQATLPYLSFQRAVEALKK